MKNYFLLVIYSLLILAAANAQQGNPFELEHRAENPFEIIPNIVNDSSAVDPEGALSVPVIAEPTKEEQEKPKNEEGEEEKSPLEEESKEETKEEGEPLLESPEKNLGLEPIFQGNPFELKSGEESFSNPIVGLNDRIIPVNENARSIPKTAASKLKNFKLAGILIMLLLLATLTTFFRLFLLKTYESFMSDNLLRTNFRATGSTISIPYFLLELFFVFNVSFTLFLLMNNLNYSSGYIFKDFFFCLMIVSILVFGKHIILWLIGFIFPLKKETSVYNFTISNFYIVLGLILVPLNLFLAYAPSSLMTLITYITAFIFIGILLYLAFRGLLIGLKYLSSNRFHFFMYLCTVEIAPVLIILKMVDNYTGS